MKNKHSIWIGILLITVLLSQTSCGLVYGSTQPKTEILIPKGIYEKNPNKSSYPSSNITEDPRPDREAEIAKIRSATLLIRMQAPKEQNIIGADLIIGLGMGSIIRLNNEILLVTHNHWGELLQDVSLVEFRNADNQIILPILGYEFKSWIVYQDAGTLALRTPTGFC